MELKAIAVLPGDREEDGLPRWLCPEHFREKKPIS